MKRAPTSIPRVGWLHDFGAVPVDNGSFASYVRDAQGQEWICKLEDNTGWQPILAEALGWLLGCRLGAPVPNVALYEGEHGRAWLSARVAFAAHWSSRHRAQVSNMDAFAAMLALDALLLNEDRHSGNILLEPRLDGGLWAWAIDMGGAIIGHVGDAQQCGVQPPSPYNHARGLPIEALASAALEAADVAALLGADDLERVALCACEVAREPDHQPLLKVLVERCLDARNITAGYLDLLRGLS